MSRRSQRARRRLRGAPPLNLPSLTRPAMPASRRGMLPFADLVWKRKNVRRLKNIFYISHHFLRL